MLRYVRAFFIALKMTLAGETISPTSANPALSAWILQGVRRVDAVYAAAQQHKLDRSARESVVVRLDGRDTSMEVILATIRHHMDVEYLYLLRDSPRSYMLAIEASNFNDQYWIERLQAAPQVQAAAVQAALRDLHDHLAALPREQPPAA